MEKHRSSKKVYTCIPVCSRLTLRPFQSGESCNGCCKQQMRTGSVLGCRLAQAVQHLRGFWPLLRLRRGTVRDELNHGLRGKRGQIRTDAEQGLSDMRARQRMQAGSILGPAAVRHPPASWAPCFSADGAPTCGHSSGAFGRRHCPRFSLSCPVSRKASSTPKLQARRQCDNANGLSDALDFLVTTAV